MDINRITAYATELLNINDQIKMLEARKATLADHVRREVTETGTYHGEGVALQVKPYTRLDDSLAKRELLPVEYEAITKQTLDTTKARKVLDADLLAKITKTFAHTVTAIVVEEDDAA